MKEVKNNESAFKADYLKTKLKEVGETESQNDKIRLHRAISWVKCAEEHSDNPDIKFITLWIAFNACYSDDEAPLQTFTEKDQFREFIKKLVNHDTEQLIFNILWNKFSGPIRLLIENKYAYKYFWVAQREKNMDWEKSFSNASRKAGEHLANQEVDQLLEVVLDRLYTVRNQLLHGGATYKSKVNRPQVKDAGNILAFLVPVIIDIMMTNIQDDWGLIKYPVIE